MQVLVNKNNVHTNLKITIPLLFPGSASHVLLRLLHLSSAGRPGGHRLKPAVLSEVFSFSHLSPAPAWALQGGSSLGNGHLHGLKWVPCLGLGTTSSSSSSCCSSDLSSSVSALFVFCLCLALSAPSHMQLPQWVSWGCLESAVLGMEQLQPVLTETPPWHLHPVQIQKKIFQSNLNACLVIQEFGPYGVCAPSGNSSEGHLQLKGCGGARTVSPPACTRSMSCREQIQRSPQYSVPWITLWHRLRVSNPGSFAGSECPTLASLAQAKPWHRSGAGLSWSEQLHARAGHGHGHSHGCGHGTGTGCLYTPTALLFCCTSDHPEMFPTLLRARNVPLFDLGSVNSPGNSGQCARMPACRTRCNELNSINLKPSEAEAI